MAYAEKIRHMKKLCIFLSLLIPNILFGQVVNHFNNIDSKWNVAKTYPNGNIQNPNFVATTTTIYGFQEDTTINSQLWLKLYSTNDSTFQNNLEFRGLITTENDLILYRDTQNLIDTLYNFNLNIGDSVLYHLNGMNPEWLKLENIDSLQLNGEFYKRFKFSEPSLSAFDRLGEVWLEGIGSIHGPLFPNFPVKFYQEISDSTFLTCSYSNHQEIWQNQSYSTCYINIVLSLENENELNFKIYPNPFLTGIKIENNMSEYIDLSILNGTGQEVKQQKITSNHEILNLSELSDGIYLFVFRTNKNIQTIKLIKKQ